MIRRRTPRRSSRTASARAFGDIHEWIRSLPWVVERRSDDRWPAIRTFEVACPPLQRYQLLLVTQPIGSTAFGEDPATQVAAVMPVEASREAEAAGWKVHTGTALPAGHVLMTVGREATDERDALEDLVLAAYSYAMS